MRFAQFNSTFSAGSFGFALQLRVVVPFRKPPISLFLRKVPGMARSKISTAPADPVRAFVEGVAKNLIDRLYGPDGPPWGTKLTELEDMVLAVRQVLSEKMLDEALQRQANTAASRPEAFRCCSKCGQEVAMDDPDPRIMQTRGGEAEWLEPATYCNRCRRSFFPSGQESGH
jgi:hypothetical protein